MNLPWRIVEPLSAKTFAEVRRRAIFECCKWDPQVEDVCSLSPQPIVLSGEAWSEVAELAGRLADEMAEAEREILLTRSGLANLGLGWRLRRALAGKGIPGSDVPEHPRFVRFDFHYTTEGWRISEANCDVPGGFNEASGFTRLMAEHFPGLSSPGDPARALATVVTQSAGPGGVIALVHATAFTDDRQVMVYLARELEAMGMKPFLISPDHLRWQDRKAFMATDWHEGPVDFIFRFFPAEWLPQLPRRCAWWHLLGNSRVPLCNPGSAILTQSKRFPLIWQELRTTLPTWRRLLPPTWDPRDAVVRAMDGAPVWKPALGRVGDGIGMRGITPVKEARAIDKAVRRRPREWIAQERFEAVPYRGAGGDVFPCVGVYTLNGRVIGAYGRISRNPLINHLAQDAAILVSDPCKTTTDLNAYGSSHALQCMGA